MKDFFIHQNQDQSVLVGGVVSLMNFAIDNIIVRVKGGLVEINGKNLIKDTAQNMKSATESNRIPNSLILFVFLATVPSTISLNPQKRYKI